MAMEMRSFVLELKSKMFTRTITGAKMILQVRTGMGMKGMYMKKV